MRSVTRVVEQWDRTSCAENAVIHKSVQLEIFLEQKSMGLARIKPLAKLCCSHCLPRERRAEHHKSCAMHAF